MFNPKTYANSRADGAAVLEIAGPGDGPRRFVPLKRTDLRGAIAGPLVQLELAHEFAFTRDQCGTVLEALYRFPLPGDAAITGVTARFGDVEIVAELQERGKAEKGYEEAKAKGDQAALVTRESPDVFTLRLAGLAPDQPITVTTRFVQLARPDGPGFSLRIPLTTAPRYVRSDESNSRHAAGQPLAMMRDPGHRFTLDVALPAGSEASSPTHKLQQQDGRVRLAEGEVVPDRDCVLKWNAPQEADRPTLQVFRHDDPADAHTYFLGLLAPPAHKVTMPVPREIVLLVDHSGSMEGAKWEAADWAVKRFLGDLTEIDTFALGLFHNDTKWFAKTAQPATAATVAKAVAFLEANRDSGGTELGVALEQAVGLPRQKGEVARHVLLITDAEVSDGGRILRLADAEPGEPGRRRIDVLCIDAAPNSFLARELAERGGGVAKFLTSDPDEGDITTALGDILADWAQPVATGLRLTVDRAGLEPAGASAVKGAIDLGDLPAGRCVWAAGRVPRGTGELTFHVATATGREVANGRSSSGTMPGLKPLFGARRVLGLEFLMNAGTEGAEFRDQLARLGYDSAVLDDAKGKKVYAENARADAAESLKWLLVSESLRYGIACAETAFLAVRKEAGQPVGEVAVVANALPAGWDPRHVTRGGIISAGLSLPPSPAPAGRGPLAKMRRAFTSGSGVSGGRGGYGGVTRGGSVRDASQHVSAPPPPMSMSFDALEAMPASLVGVSHAPPLSFDLSKRHAPAAPPPMPKAEPSSTLFNGMPSFTRGEAVLFDSAGNAALPDEAVLQRLTVEYPAGAPAALDPGLELLIFVDDLAEPAARVTLLDLFKQGGARPLNLRRRSGAPVRVVLADPSGAWATNAPAVRVLLRAR